ncbi:serine carboxypeptidase-like 48 [Bidens hawaiensis]|uniref:serine carboxypeptidase-like 48 n=1 Tax=Bidens hawaiensis TaxID=980011 RepID=UPI00404A82AC
MRDPCSRTIERSLRLPVLGESRASIHDVAHDAGYVKINHSIGARMFYYFFQSRSGKDDPVCIWLNGGPGASTALAVFEENGPFHLTKHLSLVWNDYGWDKVCNIIYVDKPTGTGFSYSSSKKDIRRDEKGVSEDMYDFLQEFFKQHPDYVKNDLYITGESYGGHFVPALATRIIHGNRNKDGIHLNLKGIAIGNELTQPKIQFLSVTDFALQNKLINQQDYNRINKMMVPECEKAVNQCGTNGHKICADAWRLCLKIVSKIVNISNTCGFDIRRQSCTETPEVQEFLNKAYVKKILGVPRDVKFVSISEVVFDAMKEDKMRNLEVGLPELLENGIKMLVYAGEYDLLCNWLGSYRWVKAMKWLGQPGFEAARVVKFMVDGKEAGELKNHGPFTFLKVHDAGHQAPSDQPKASLQMLKLWIDGKLK